MSNSLYVDNLVLVNMLNEFSVVILNVFFSKCFLVFEFDVLFGCKVCGRCKVFCVVCIKGLLVFVLVINNFVIGSVFNVLVRVLGVKVCILKCFVEIL